MCAVDPTVDSVGGGAAVLGGADQSVCVFVPTVRNADYSASFQTSKYSLSAERTGFSLLNTKDTLTFNSFLQTHWGRTT